MRKNRNGQNTRTRRAGAFDIRTFIGLLLGIYGVILLLTGYFATSQQDLAKAGDVNVNLWTGLGLVAVAVTFQVWARVRPLAVPDDFQAGDEAPSGH